MRYPGLFLFALLVLPFLPWRPAAAEYQRAGLEPTVLDFNTIVRDERRSDDCALTFDDGPGPYTGTLLDLLRQRATHATFFVLGKHVRQHPDLIRRMVAEGHEVENHSWDHPDMRHLDSMAQVREIDDTERLLQSLGVRSHFFRPPYGSYDKSTIAAAQNEGLIVVLWSHDSQDWRYHTLDSITGVLLHPGPDRGIFLFHDIQPSTVALMPGILDRLAADGCRFVPLGQWLMDNARP